MQDKEQLKRLIDALDNDIHNGLFHFELYRDLREADYDVEMSQSRAFWCLTIAAHLKASLGSLYRAYDQSSHEGVLSLPTLLNTARNHTDWFESTPDLNEIERDLDRITCDSDIDEFRTKVYAHREVENVANAVPTHDFASSKIEKMFKTAAELINKYNRLFQGTTSGKLVGADDYQHVLECIREQIQASELQ